MIKIYKILSGKYDEAVTPTVNRILNLNTRGYDVRFLGCKKIVQNMILGNIHLLTG